MLWYIKEVEARKICRSIVLLLMMKLSLSPNSEESLAEKISTVLDCYSEGRSREHPVWKMKGESKVDQGSRGHADARSPSAFLFSPDYSPKAAAERPAMTLRQQKAAFSELLRSGSGPWAPSTSFRPDPGSTTPGGAALTTDGQMGKAEQKMMAAARVVREEKSNATPSSLWARKMHEGVENGEVRGIHLDTENDKKSSSSPSNRQAHLPSTSACLGSFERGGSSSSTDSRPNLRTSSMTAPRPEQHQPFYFVPDAGAAPAERTRIPNAFLPGGFDSGSPTNYTQVFSLRDMRDHPDWPEERPAFTIDLVREDMDRMLHKAKDRVGNI